MARDSAFDFVAEGSICTRASRGPGDGLLPRSVRSAPDSKTRAFIRAAVQRIEVQQSELAIRVEFGVVDPHLQGEAPIDLLVPISCVRTGKQVKLIIPAAIETKQARDPALVKLVAQALFLRARIGPSEASTFDQLASALGYSREHAADLLRVSYLVPDILAAIISGKQPPTSRARV
jgi:hypothetical protein